uniref:Dedicator of cytokinesis protein 1 n=1 Tax=Acrobeloides nanus TaxID=290746 RepID=A0A914CL85_9BILA
DSSRYTTTKKSEVDAKLAISITAQAFMGSIEKIREKHSDSFISSIPVIKRVNFKSDYCDIRNEVYINLSSADFHWIKGQKNIEGRISVVEPDSGSILQDSIEVTTPDGVIRKKTYHTRVFMNDERPRFNETIKVRLPDTTCRSLNLRILFYNKKIGSKSEKGPIALASIPILQDYRLTTTSEHEEEGVPVFKLDSGKIYDEATLHKEIQKASNSRLFYRMLVLSNMHTKEARLLPILFQWKECQNDLKTCLEDVYNLNGQAEELLKFLPPIFDALIEMAELNPNLRELIFDLIIWMLRQCERQFEFKKVFEEYVSNIYHINAFSYLLSNLFKSLKQAFESEGQAQEENSRVLVLLRLAGYLSKMIVFSKEAFDRLYPEKQKDEEFNELVTSILNLMFDIIQTGRNIFIKTATLRYLPSFIAPIIEHSMYDLVTLARFFTNLLHGLPEDIKVTYKFTPIKEIVNTDLFASQDYRQELLPKVLDLTCQELELYMELPETKTNAEYMVNIELGAQILTDILERLFPFNSKTVYFQCGTYEELKLIINRCLRSVNQAIGVLMHEPSHIRSLFALLLALMDKCSAPIFSEYIAKGEPNDKFDFLIETLHMFTELLEKNPLSGEWYQMRFIFYRLVNKHIRFIMAITTTSAEESMYVEEILNELFDTLVAFVNNVTTDRMGIYSEATGELRNSSAASLRSLWFMHNQHEKAKLMPRIFPKVLLLAVRNNNNVRRKILPILADMVLVEFYLKQEQRLSVPVALREIKNSKFLDDFIFELDAILSQCPDSTTFRRQLCDELKNRCQSDSQLYTNGCEAFINKIDKVLSLLIDYNQVQTSFECHENKMLCIVRLIEFYASIKHRLYLTYLLKLYEIHIQLGNRIEAAHVLKRIAESLKWDEEQLTGSHQEIRDHLKCEYKTQRELKVKIYLDIASLFDDGEHWELAIEILEELSQIYKKVFLDYNKLSETIRRIAELYDKITKTIRMESYYFLVAFYGGGFPDYLSNKKFVFRGEKLEMFQNFKERMLNNYCGAKFIETVEDCSNTELVNSNEKFIQIIPITPQQSLTDGLTNLPSNPLTHWYRKFHRVSCFEQFRKNIRNDTKWTSLESNEATKLWITRRIFEINQQLPDILNFAKVVKEYGTEPMHPVEVAVHEMQKTNNSLLESAQMVSAGLTELMISLGGKIRGILQADVGGGIRNYEAFFSKKATSICNESESNLVEKLRMLLSEHVSTVEFALFVHASQPTLINENFHNTLVNFFENYRKRTETVCGCETVSFLPEGISQTSLYLENAEIQQTPLTNRTVSNASFEMDGKENSIFRNAAGTLIRTTISRSKQGTPIKKPTHERNDFTNESAPIQPNIRKFSEHFALLRDSARNSNVPSKPQLPPRKTAIHSKELIQRENNEELFE